MGDAMDEEKERKQQLAGVRHCGGSRLLSCRRWCGWQGRGRLRALPNPPCWHRVLLPQLHACKQHSLAATLPGRQVRKEARAAIQRERDQQIALMIAK